MTHKGKIFMTDLMYEIIESYSDRYAFKLVNFAGGKGVYLVKNNKIIAKIYDNDFGLNSSAVSNLVANRVDFLRTLAENHIPCSQVFVLGTTNPKSVEQKLLSLLANDGNFNICVQGLTHEKCIASPADLNAFLDAQEYPCTLQISVAHERIGGYSVLIQKGMVACVMCSRSEFIVGDGESAIWEILSTEHISDYNKNLDLNQIPYPNEKVYIGDPTRNIGMTLEEVTDFKIVSDIAKLVNFANSKIGLSFGMYSVYYSKGEYIIDGATTRVILDNFAKANNNNLIKTCNLIENAIKQLVN